MRRPALRADKHWSMPKAAAKQSLLEDIQEHAQVSLTHVKAAEEAKEPGAEHLTAAKTALYDALRAKDAASAKKAVESAENHLEMINKRDQGILAR
jgi:hypothetical protein